MPIRKKSWIVGFSGGLYEIQGPFWKIMDCKHIFLKVQGFICKIMDCKHILLKAWGLICKKWWTAVMIFAKWNIFFKTTIARPLWVVRAAIRWSREANNYVWVFN
jgi:hypothetical protein